MQVYTRMQQCVLYLNIRSVEMRRSASANPVDAIGGIGGIGGIGYYWPGRYWTCYWLPSVGGAGCAGVLATQNPMDGKPDT